MKKKNDYKLYLVAAILFFIAAIILFFTDNRTLGATDLCLASAFLSLSVTNKKNKDKE